jgi:hypothetical protein
VIRYLWSGAAVVALSLPGVSAAQAAPSGTALATEARIAALRKLAELRAEESNLRAQLGSLAAPVVAPVPPAVPAVAPAAAPAPAPAPAVLDAKAPKAVDQAKGGVTDFLAHFSVGAAVLLFDSPMVETAEFTGVNRRVIITESRDHLVTPWLQANYVWDAAYNRRFWFSESTMPGIFAVVGMGSDGSFLDTFGIGAQLSFRRLAPGKSLNLGVGYYFSSKKELASGIVEGEPLPVEYDQIKYRRKSADGVMINLSFGFQ